MKGSNYYGEMGIGLKNPSHHQQKTEDNHRNTQRGGDDQNGQHNADDHDGQADNGGHQPPGEFDDALNQAHQDFERPEQSGGILSVIIHFFSSYQLIRKNCQPVLSLTRNPMWQPAYIRYRLSKKENNNV